MSSKPSTPVVQRSESSGECLSKTEFAVMVCPFNKSNQRYRPLTTQGNFRRRRGIVELFRSFNYLALPGKFRGLIATDCITWSAIHDCRKEETQRLEPWTQR